MTGRSGVGRYAKALLDVSVKEGDPVRAERELSSFADLLGANAELRQALFNPAIPADRRKAVVSALAERAGYSSEVSKLLVLLADRGRIAMLSDLVESYRDRLREFQKVVLARVTSAVPLPADRVQAIERSLSQLTARKVTVETSVDPSLIGGIVARIGSRVYDGSVKTHLGRLKTKLAGG